VALRAPLGVEVPYGGRVLGGVAGWADSILTGRGVFYPHPAGTTSPAARLRHYASHFPMVEVDSTYYTLPTRDAAAAWAACTPERFTLDVKAHGLMTGHGADVRRLPDWLRRELPRDLVTAGRVYAGQLAPPLVDEVWRRFLDALAPLRDAGKLGAVLLQYPCWFTPSRGSARALARARERLGDDVGAVEFRHRDWLGDRLAPRTLRLLERVGLAYVIVDGPQGMASSVPPLVAVTSRRLAGFRFHGRRRDTWETRTAPASERYRYLYDEGELAPWAARVLEVARREARVHVIFNNCHGNYGAANAVEFTPLLLGGGSAPS